MSRHDPAACVSVTSGRLHAVFHADQIGDVALQPLIERDEEIGGLHRRPRNFSQIRGELRGGRHFDEMRRQLARLFGRVSERVVLGVRLEKEIERIVHRHFRHEVDFDAQFARLVRKHQPREIIRLRVLLPVDEVLARIDAHGIAQDAGAAVRRGTQPRDLRTEVDRAVVTVVRDVTQRDVN